MLFTWPLMAAIQEISARIGRVTGEGIAGNIREHYPRSLLLVIVALLLVSQHHQPRRRSWRHGRRIAALAARLGTALRRVVCRRLRAARSVLALRKLCPHPEMDGGVVVCLCRHRAGGRCAVGAGRLSYLCPGPCLEPGLSRRDRRGPRHDDHALLLFLAILGGGGRRGDRSHGTPADRRPGRSALTDQANPHRHLSRHGVFQSDQPVHHHHHGGDPERARHHRHPDVIPGRRGIAPDRRRVHLCRIRRRHHRDRPARGAGFGRLGCLCAGRGAGLADRAPAPAKRRKGVLRHDRRRHA